MPSTTSGPPRGNLGGPPATPKGWLMEVLNLQGLGKWPEVEQEQARELLLKWKQLFSYTSLDLGRTALIKHQIEVTDWMPFKECHQHIHPCMYDDMKAHLQEMLDIGTI